MQEPSTHPGGLYHHCMPAAAAHPTTIRPDPSRSDSFFLPAYEWVRQVTGFYPLFLAVGNSIRMTGYQDNWKVRAGGDFVEGKYQKNYRKKGGFPNLAVFSFDQIDGVFMDYDYWHIALNAYPNGRTVTEAEKKMIFKPSWTTSRWIRAALKGTHQVQLVVPELPLDKAMGVFVRNDATRKMAEERGFKNVQVKRIDVDRW
jgi:hypothetical protein